MNNDADDLLLIVTYTIVFLFVFLIAIIIFIIKSRKDRIKIEEKKREIEIIAKQKTVLLKEIHHRVKNNLQLISGLLYLQSVKHKNVEVTAMIDESQKHINSIALVHEMLYKDDTLSLVVMEKYLTELGNRLLQFSPIKNIEYKLHVNKVALPVDYATTLGLILNELLTNSLKYAFSTQEGCVTVSLKEINTNEFEFTYADNGKGFEIDKITSDTLGQRLIKMLAEEIKANLTVKNEQGLCYTFKFETQAS
jgi:two-component sensor histidine kinase